MLMSEKDVRGPPEGAPKYNSNFYRDSSYKGMSAFFHELLSDIASCRMLYSTLQLRRML